MAQIVLKQEIVETIMADTILFGKVAAALGLSIKTTYTLLPTNPPRIATASVLKVLRDHLKIKKDSELLMEEPVAA